jgi:hypothetical protein
MILMVVCKYISGTNLTPWTVSVGVRDETDTENAFPLGDAEAS